MWLSSHNSNTKYSSERVQKPAYTEHQVDFDGFLNIDAG
jgi:hypothetical protein